MPRAFLPILVLFFARCFAFQAPSAPHAGHLEDPFATGWMLVDTNSDGIADFINGKVVVGPNPSAAQNAAAANIAARLGYGTTGLTPPLVVAEYRGNGPRIDIGKEPEGMPPGGFEKEEGGVFQSDNGLLIAGADNAGLTAAAEAYSARAPYIWRMNGEKLSAIAEATGAELIGVTYLRGKSGIHRAILRGSNLTDAALAAARQAGARGGPSISRRRRDGNQPQARSRGARRNRCRRPRARCRHRWRSRR